MDARHVRAISQQIVAHIRLPRFVEIDVLDERRFHLLQTIIRMLPHELLKPKHGIMHHIQCLVQFVDNPCDYKEVIHKPLSFNHSWHWHLRHLQGYTGEPRAQSSCRTFCGRATHEIDVQNGNRKQKELDAGYPESQKWYVNDALMSCI